MADHKLFIDGEYVDALSGETFTTYDPGTDQPIGEVAKAGREDAQLIGREMVAAMRIECRVLVDPRFVAGRSGRANLRIGNSRRNFSQRVQHHRTGSHASHRVGKLLACVLKIHGPQFASGGPVQIHAGEARPVSRGHKRRVDGHVGSRWQ